MPHYFARTISVPPDTFRLQTRIDLTDAAGPLPGDRCVAAIVGKNRGSACTVSSAGVLTRGDDKMLPYVRNTFTQACQLSGKSCHGVYIAIPSLPSGTCPPALAE